ncbi:hypothetical protein HJFPF1_00383 [Paramyrothecium foliicola]|nr:hypothetical protein HJFPF1_00383 [Paramyrothecium foliicola]
MLARLSALLLLAQGVALQASAYETFAVAKNFDKVERSGCPALDHCRGGHHGHHHKPHHHHDHHHDHHHHGHRHGTWVPDPRTFFFPHSGNEYGRSWPLCKDHSFCDPKYAFGQVSFDFYHGHLVFELENKDGYCWKDVEIYVQTNGPPTDHSYRLAHCEPDHHKPGVTRCRAPYYDLVKGEHHKDICPKKNEGSWIFYIQIKARAVRGHEEVLVYSRGIKPDVCWFSLSYCCTECKFSGHPHRLPHRSLDEKEYDEKKFYDEKYYDGEDFEEIEYFEEEKYDEKYDGKKDDQKKHGEKKHGGENPENEFKLPKGVEQFREENRYEEGFDCDGALVAVYGRTKTGRPLHELSDGKHHKSCQGKQGVYQRVSKRELELSVRGDLEVDDKRFGKFIVGLDKKGPDAQIAVSIDVDEKKKLKVTEAAVFVKCDPGDDKSQAEDICKPETWPLTFANFEGLSSHKFNIVNKVQCKGDYFIAVWVKACLKKDGKCEHEE